MTEQVIDPIEPIEQYGFCVPASYVIRRMGDLSDAHNYTDEQIAALHDAQALPQWETDWRRLYELIGRIVFTAADVEEALTPIVTFLLNPEKMGHARWAVQTLDQSAKLSIFVKLLPEEWIDGIQLNKHLIQMGVDRNRVAHGTWNHFKIGKDGVFKLGWWHTYRNSTKTRLTEVETTFELLRDRAREFEVLKAVLELLLELLGDGFGVEYDEGQYGEVDPPIEATANPSIVATAKERMSWGSPHQDRPFDQDWFLPTLERLFPAK